MQAAEPLGVTAERLRKVTAAALLWCDDEKPPPPRRASRSLKTVKGVGPLHRDVCSTCGTKSVKTRTYGGRRREDNAIVQPLKIPNCCTA